MSKFRKATSRKLRVDSLERRENPSSFIDGAGNLVIVGSDLADQVEVVYRPSTGSGVFATTPKLEVTQNGVKSSFSPWAVTGHIEFLGYGGDDFFDAEGAATPVKAYGMEGNDTLIGGSRDDYLEGSIHNDILVGVGGHDTLVGGTGYDRLYGGTGNDSLDGSDDTDRDHLAGGEGVNRFQQDWWGAGQTYNADHPVDYQSGVDYFFNEYQNGGW